MERSIFTQRGKPKFVHDGYAYVFDKFSACGTVEFWRCGEKNNGCKVRIHKKGPDVQKILHHHTHDSGATKIEAAKVVCRIKERSAVTQKNTSQVINECIAGVSQAVKVRKEILFTRTLNFLYSEDYFLDSQ